MVLNFLKSIAQCVESIFAISALLPSSEPVTQMPLKCDEYWMKQKFEKPPDSSMREGTEGKCFYFKLYCLGSYILNALSQLNSLHGWKIILYKIMGARLTWFYLSELWGVNICWWQACLVSVWGEGDWPVIPASRIMDVEGWQHSHLLDNKCSQNSFETLWGKYVRWWRKIRKFSNYFS